MININNQNQAFASVNMDQPSNGGPAFPVPFSIDPENGGPVFAELYGNGGMTLRQYAAIKLRVPESGTDWLDEMIRKSARNEFAARAMQSYVALDNMAEDGIAASSYELADAMLRARGEA